MKNTAWRRSLSVCVAICLFLPPTGGKAFAEPSGMKMPVSFPEDLNQIHVPANIGKLEESFQGDERLVILVQDAHSIPEAQRNIRNLIDFFQQTHGLETIAVEGARGELDPQIFRSFPDREKLRTVFNEYLQKGELTGTAFAAVFNRSEARYREIENWNLYEEGYGYYLQAGEETERAGELLEVMNRTLQAQKEKIYSAKLLSVDRALRDFDQQISSLMEVLEVLASVKAPLEGSELSLMLEENSKHPESRSSLEIEVKIIAEKIRQYFSVNPTRGRQDAVAEFNQRHQAFLTSSITAEQFALYLKELSSELNLPFLFSREFQERAKRQKKMEDIEGTRFFNEFERYAESVRQELFQSEEERRLDKQSRRLYLLERLKDLELTRSQWQELKTYARHGEFQGPNHIFLNETDFERLIPEKKLRETVKNHFLFYENAEKRDGIFVENLERILSEEKNHGREAQKKAVMLVAGGFHTEGVLKRLKDSGISYLLLRPQIEALPKELHYKDHMNGQVSWRDYFQPEKGEVNVYNAFVRHARDRLKELDKQGFPEKSEISFKEWRDQIIRDLSAKGKVSEASRYTRFIDEIVSGKKSTDKDSLNLIEKANIFIAGLKDLKERNQLTETNILSLLKPVAMISPKVTGNSLVPLSVSLGRAELRSLYSEDEVPDPARKDLADEAKRQRFEAIARKAGLANAGVLRSVVELANKPAEGKEERGAAWVSQQLKSVTVGEGVAGLSSAEVTIRRGLIPQNVIEIVYRDDNFKPVAMARLTQNLLDEWQIHTLAADSTRGLLTGRAVREVAARALQSLSSFRQSSVDLSPEGAAFINAAVKRILRKLDSDELAFIGVEDKPRSELRNPDESELRALSRSSEGQVHKVWSYLNEHSDAFQHPDDEEGIEILDFLENRVFLVGQTFGDEADLAVVAGLFLRRNASTARMLEERYPGILAAGSTQQVQVQVSDLGFGANRYAYTITVVEGETSDVFYGKVDQRDIPKKRSALKDSSTYLENQNYELMRPFFTGVPSPDLPFAEQFLTVQAAKRWVQFGRLVPGLDLEKSIKPLRPENPADSSRLRIYAYGLGEMSGNLYFRTYKPGSGGWFFGDMKAANVAVDNTQNRPRIYNIDSELLMIPSAQFQEEMAGAKPVSPSAANDELALLPYKVIFEPLYRQGILFNRTQESPEDRAITEAQAANLFLAGFLRPLKDQENWIFLAQEATGLEITPELRNAIESIWYQAEQIDAGAASGFEDLNLAAIETEGGWVESRLGESYREWGAGEISERSELRTDIGEWEKEVRAKYFPKLVEYYSEVTRKDGKGLAVTSGRIEDALDLAHRQEADFRNFSLHHSDVKYDFAEYLEGTGNYILDPEFKADLDRIRSVVTAVISREGGGVQFARQELSRLAWENEPQILNVIIHRLARAMELEALQKPEIDRHIAQFLREYMKDRFNALGLPVADFTRYLREHYLENGYTIVFLGRGTEQVQRALEELLETELEDYRANIIELLASTQMIRNSSPDEIKEYLRASNISGQEKIVFVDTGFQARVAKPLVELVRETGVESEFCLLCHIKPSPTLVQRIRERLSYFFPQAQPLGVGYNEVEEIYADNIDALAAAAHFFDDLLGKRYEMVWRLQEGVPVVQATRTPLFYALTNEVFQEWIDDLRALRNREQSSRQELRTSSEVDYYWIYASDARDFTARQRQGDGALRSYLNRHREQWAGLSAGVLPYLIQKKIQAFQSGDSSSKRLVLVSIGPGNEELARNYYEVSQELIRQGENPLEWELVLVGLEGNEDVYQKGVRTLAGRQPFHGELIRPKEGAPDPYSDWVVEYLNEHRLNAQKSMRLLYQNVFDSDGLAVAMPQDTDIIFVNHVLRDFIKSEEASSLVENLSRLRPEAFLAVGDVPAVLEVLEESASNHLFEQMPAEARSAEATDLKAHNQTAYFLGYPQTYLDEGKVFLETRRSELREAAKDAVEAFSGFAATGEDVFGERVVLSVRRGDAINFSEFLEIFAESIGQSSRLSADEYIQKIGTVMEDIASRRIPAYYPRKQATFVVSPSVERERLDQARALALKEAVLRSRDFVGTVIFHGLPDQNGIIQRAVIEAGAHFQPVSSLLRVRSFEEVPFLPLLTGDQQRREVGSPQTPFMQIGVVYPESQRSDAAQYEDAFAAFLQFVFGYVALNELNAEQLNFLNDLQSISEELKKEELPATPADVMRVYGERTGQGAEEKIKEIKAALMQPLWALLGEDVIRLIGGLETGSPNILISQIAKYIQDYKTERAVAQSA